MSRIRNVLSARDSHIWTLRMCLAALVLLLVLVLWGWGHAQGEITVHVPPDLSQGAQLQAAQVPKANVYAFAYYIYQNLNFWGTDGTQDYRLRLREYSCYLSPRFRRWLENNYQEKQALGELRRTRAVSATAPYREERVEQLGNGSWVVWLDLAIREWMELQLVKETAIRYPLRVVRYDVARECNPVGLALDGFADTPSRIASESPSGSAEE